MRSCSHPQVTVIVPVYKVEKYLERCIDSIINQSYSNLEIILVDDGSPDRCPAICDSYALREERIKVIHKENGGLSSARNAGINEANGQYFCFVDSDDYILPDMIEQLVRSAQTFRTSISACSFSSEEDRMQPGLTDEIRLFSAAEALREILTDGVICTSAWAKLYDRALFSDVVFPEKMIFEDYATVYKLVHKAGMIAFADMAKYYYTPNYSGITKSSFSAKQMDYFTVSDEVEGFVKENYPELTAHVRNRKVDMAVSLFRKLSVTPERDRFRAEKKILAHHIRKGLLGFLAGRYPMRKKLSGLSVSLFPNLTEKIFAALFS